MTGIDFCHYCPVPNGADRLPDVPFRIAELPDLIALLLPDLTR